MVKEVRIDQDRKFMIEQKVRQRGIVILVAKSHPDADCRCVFGQCRRAHQIPRQRERFVFDDGDQPRTERIGCLRCDDTRSGLFPGDDVQVSEIALMTVVCGT